MLTISQLARRFDLSRSTLLYYDSIGLLRPSLRSEANYRLYSEEDVEKMALVNTYRRAGLPLADIARLLESGGGSLRELLEARLEGLNQEIHALRRQQQLILELLQDHADPATARSLDKDAWVAILRATGLDDDDMQRWHVEFERLSPEAHQDFLESLGLGEEKIREIREWSRDGN